MKLKQTIKTLIVAGAVLLGGVLLPVAQPALVHGAAKDEVQKGINQVGGKENDTNLTDFIKDIINILLFVIGAVAVIMIIIGGIRYVLSNGEQANVKAAKDTILYAVIGLVVALLAYAIVNFVVASIK